MKESSSVSLARQLAVAALRLWLFDVLIQQRQVAVIQFRHFGTVADDLLGHISHLAVEGLRPQRSDNKQNLLHIFPFLVIPMTKVLISERKTK